MERSFYYERLDVYQKALAIFLAADAIVRPLHREWGFLRFQVRRAAMSIGANIAEGAMEHPQLERNRFFRIAKRSAGECGYFAGAMLLRGLGDPDALKALRAMLLEEVAMLTALMRKSRPSP